MGGDRNRTTDESMGIDGQPYLFKISEDAPSFSESVLSTCLKDSSKVIGDVKDGD